MQVFYSLKELPAKYEWIFQTGKIPKNQGFEYYHSQTAYILMGILTLFPVLPLVYVLLGMISSALYFVYENPQKFLATLFETWWTTILLVGLFLLCAVLILMVFYGCFYVIMMFFQDIKVARGKRQNCFYHGLLLDNNYFLWRKKHPFESIIMIPKTNIKAFNTYYKRGDKGRRIKYFALEYQTSEGDFHIEIPNNEFQMGNKDTDDIVQAWLKKD